ncbi:hypothetical protein QBC35DRAFT_98142 [Podospora australis]|uniref:Uncharacterized protein n=1 Tax=Podospora australis TaxID=1536484 RepID=A0AAN6WKE5_9PEZI|nr:hypothetical protein QBC35DRAFT_98142 [Podospora australis]
MLSVKTLALFALVAVVKVGSAATLPVRALEDPTKDPVETVELHEAGDHVKVVEVFDVTHKTENTGFDLIVEHESPAVEDIFAHEHVDDAIELVEERVPLEDHILDAVVEDDAFEFIEEHEPLEDHILEDLVEDGAHNEAVEVVVEKEGPNIDELVDDSEEEPAIEQVVVEEETSPNVVFIRTSAIVEEETSPNSCDIVEWCLQACQNHCNRFLPLEAAGCYYRGCAYSCITSYPKTTEEQRVKAEEIIEEGRSNRIAKRHVMGDVEQKKLTGSSWRGPHRWIAGARW